MNDFLCLIVILSMIFCHIVDDFYLQGVLSNLKQKNWWKEHYPYDMYEYDYLAALFLHAFSWDFVVHIPIVVAIYFVGKYPNAYLFIFEFFINLFVHGFVDFLKANKRKLSLATDQFIHIWQIFFIFLVYTLTDFL